MNTEILFLAEKIKDTYNGDPWFGRSVKSILNEIDESIAFEKPNGRHSILELLWHMITWKEFTISRLRKNEGKNLQHFEEEDWRELDHADKTLWKKGMEKFGAAQVELIELIQQQKDEILSQKVKERAYDFRKLFYGILEHDVYHLGQIAYIKKLLQNKN